MNCFKSTYDYENQTPFPGVWKNPEITSILREGWYDYGARNYDPQLGMWFNPDPLMEYYSSSSPYNYCLNDPVNNIDPNGMYVAPNYSLWDGRGESTGGGENRGGGGCRGWSYNGGRDNDERDRERDSRNNDDGSDSSFDIWDYVDAVWADTYKEINRINKANNSSEFGSTEEMVKFAWYNTPDNHSSVLDVNSNILWIIDLQVSSSNVAQSTESTDGWTKVPGGYLPTEGEEQSYYVHKNGSLIPSWRAENLPQADFNKSFNHLINPGEVGPYVSGNQINFNESVNNITLSLGYPFYANNSFSMWSENNMMLHYAPGELDFQINAGSGNYVAWQSSGYIQDSSFVGYFTLTVTR